MLRTTLTVCLILLSNSIFAQSLKYVGVPTGDVAALSQAILEANNRPMTQTTVILLQGQFSFSAEDTLPPIERNITIHGYPGAAVFRGEDEGPEQLFHIVANSKLSLINIELANFSLNHGGEGLIENLGELVMTKVQLSSVSSNQICHSFGVCSSVMPAITNRSSGLVNMKQVSFIDSGGTYDISSALRGGLITNDGNMVMVNIQLYLSEDSWFAAIANSGFMRLVNSSFKYAAQSGASELNLVTSDSPGKPQFANSVFAGFSGEWCQQATSLGHNLNDAADCNWSKEGDLVGVPAGLIWRPVDGRWSDRGQEILKTALVPLAASAAVDSADAERCPGASLLNDRRVITDGNGDGQAGCDRGAVELSPIGLAEGGINGLYFNPDADGHYLYILQNDYNTLVVWTTFDSDGNQVWVYGTGELKNGRSLIAKTYINRNGKVTLNGAIEAAQEQHWGTLEVDMTSCTEGVVGFHSDLPEFGSGQFLIRRLAYVKQLGCIDL